MANGVTRFQKHGRQFQPIQRYQYTDDLQAEQLLSLHTGATKRRKSPQAVPNRFVRSRMDGVSAGGQHITGGTGIPRSNSKYV